MRKTFLILIATGMLAISQLPAQTHGQFYRNGVAVSLTGQGIAYVPAICFLVDPCAVDEVFISRSDFPPGTEPSANASPILIVDCNDVGTVIVQIWSRTGDGPWESAETYLSVQAPIYDCDFGGTQNTLPVPIVIDGIAISPGGNGECVVNASLYNIASNGVGPLTYSFSSDPNDDTRIFTCDDTGAHGLEFWVTDAEGNQNFVNCYVYMPPEVTCTDISPQAPDLKLFNGFAATLINKWGMAVHAADFVVNPVPGYTYAFSNDPADTWINADCNTLWTQLVDIYAFNEQGELQNWGATYFLHGDPLDLCLQGEQPPLNDNVCDALILDGFMGSSCTWQFTNGGATVENNEPTPQAGTCDTPGTWCDNGTANHTVWFTFTAPASGSIRIETDVFDTQLALWEADDCTAILNGDALLVAANDNHAGNPRGGALLDGVTCLIPGQVYYLQVDGNGDAKGFFTLAIADPGLACELLTGPSTCGDDLPNALSSGLGLWQHLTNAEGQLVASVDDQGQNLGSIDLALQINEGAIRTDDEGRPYLDRNWTITPEHQPQEPVMLRLYFSQSEWDAFLAASSNTQGLDQLRVTKVSGGACGDYNGGGEVLTPVDYGQIGTDIYYVTLQIDGFSIFYIHGEEPLVVGSREAISNNTVKVWPNPTTRKVWIDVPKGCQGEALWQLFDAQGNKMQEQKLLLSNNTSIDLGSLPVGSYFYRLTQSQQVIGIGKIGVVK